MGILEPDHRRIWGKGYSAQPHMSGHYENRHDVYHEYPHDPGWLYRRKGSYLHPVAGVMEYSVSAARFPDDQVMYSGRLYDVYAVMAEVAERQLIIQPSIFRLLTSPERPISLSFPISSADSFSAMSIIYESDNHAIIQVSEGGGEIHISSDINQTGYSTNGYFSDDGMVFGYYGRDERNTFILQRVTEDVSNVDLEIFESPVRQEQLLALGISFPVSPLILSVYFPSPNSRTMKKLRALHAKPDDHRALINTAIDLDISGKLVLDPH